MAICLVCYYTVAICSHSYVDTSGTLTQVDQLLWDTGLGPL